MVRNIEISHETEGISLEINDFGRNLAAVSLEILAFRANRARFLRNKGEDSSFLTEWMLSWAKCRVMASSLAKWLYILRGIKASESGFPFSISCSAFKAIISVK